MKIKKKNNKKKPTKNKQSFVLAGFLSELIRKKPLGL